MEECNVERFYTGQMSGSLLGTSGRHCQCAACCYLNHGV